MFKNNPFHRDSHLRRAFARRPEPVTAPEGSWSNATPEKIAADINSALDEIYAIPDDIMLPGYCPQSDDVNLVEVLERQLDLAGEIMTEQGDIILAARHLIDVMAMKSADGQPVFRLNDDTRRNHDILIHAVMNLQARLNGTELPSFAELSKLEIN